MTLPKIQILNRILLLVAILSSANCQTITSKMPSMNLASMFKKKAPLPEDETQNSRGDADTLTESKVDRTNQSNKSLSLSSPSPSPERSILDPSANLGTNPDDRQFGLGNPFLEKPAPEVVKPRQPSVDLTPPTLDRTLNFEKLPEPKEPESGGLQPRAPTLEIVTPGRN